MTIGGLAWFEVNGPLIELIGRIRTDLILCESVRSVQSVVYFSHKADSIQNQIDCVARVWWAGLTRR